MIKSWKNKTQAGKSQVREGHTPVREGSKRGFCPETSKAGNVGIED